MPPGSLRRLHVHTCMRGRICVTGAFKPHTRVRAHPHTFAQSSNCCAYHLPAEVFDGGFEPTGLSSFAYQGPRGWFVSPVGPDTGGPASCLLQSLPRHSLKTHAGPEMLPSNPRPPTLKEGATALTEDRHETRRRRHTTPAGEM